MNVFLFSAPVFQGDFKHLWPAVLADLRTDSWSKKWGKRESFSSSY